MKKNLVLKLVALCLVISVCCNIKFYSDYEQLKETKTVDYTIYPASLPANELLRVTEAKELARRAFNDGVFYAVVDVDALITLIQHAWQWDKNAMLHYDNIVSSADLYNSNYKEEGMISLDEFMFKYRDKLVDRYGRPLVEPGIFKHPDFRNYFDEKMTELEYPYFVNNWGLILGSGGYDDNGVARKAPEEGLEQSIYYLTIGIENGYHEYETLIARMLFQSGKHFKYDLRRRYSPEPKAQLNPLTEHRNGISPERLQLAIDYAQIMATHSSLMGMLRVSEAYLYNLGRERNWVTAYAWVLLMDFTCQELVRKRDYTAWNKQEGDIVMEYQATLKARLEKNLSESQKQESRDLLAQLKETIIDWDYNKWVDQIDDINPRP